MNIKRTLQALVPSLLIPLLVPLGALSAPSITSLSSSIISQGQNVTISGAGFGVKSAVSPVLWDTVDNQAAYSTLSNGTTIPTGTGKPWGANSGMKLSTTEGRLGDKCYKATNTSSGTLENLKIGSSPNYIYVSWWWKPSANPLNPVGNHSSKFIRLSNEANLVYQTYSWTQMQSYVYNNPNYAANDWWDWPGMVNQWNFHEVLVNNINRTYSVKVNGKPYVNNSSWASGTAFKFDYLWMIGWDGGGVAPPAITTWMDDIYVDNSLARVMICDSSNYSSATKCEMQIPNTIWNDGQIQVTVNQGSFPASSTAYLYVVDTSGNVSASKQITFGSGDGGGTATIAPPSGLRIVN